MLGLGQIQIGDLHPSQIAGSGDRLNVATPKVEATCSNRIGISASQSAREVSPLRDRAAAPGI
jgi:hypothetical protein